MTKHEIDFIIDIRRKYKNITLVKKIFTPITK